MSLANHNHAQSDIATRGETTSCETGPIQHTLARMVSHPLSFCARLGSPLVLLPATPTFLLHLSPPRLSHRRARRESFPFPLLACRLLHAQR
jgi:hypothetical protein